MSKDIKVIAKKFHNDMQDVANSSGCTISAGLHGEEMKVIASPEEDMLNAVKNAQKESREISGIQVNKIKYDRKGCQVEINYDQITGDGRDDIKIILKSGDKPKPEFIETLDKLAPFVEQICQLEDDYCKDAEIRGVSISYSHDVMGACITCLIPLYSANSPLCINTPFLPSGQYNEGGEAPVMPSGCALLIEQLVIYAENYIYGDRDPKEDNQLKLELD